MSLPAPNFSHGPEYSFTPFFIIVRVSAFSMTSSTMCVEIITVEDCEA